MTTGVLLDTSIFSTDLGWRLGFGLGALLAIGIMLVRRYLPESPRWLMVHGRPDEAERLVSEIEETVKEQTGRRDLPEPDQEIEIHPRESTGSSTSAGRSSRSTRGASCSGFALMGHQAFLYNAVLFNFRACSPASSAWATASPGST